MDRSETVNTFRTASEATATLFGRLARDRAGNTLALIAAATLPMLALVGGGIDMSRSYLAQARLQQACDAGVLAARKKLGTSASDDGAIPSSVADIGNRFFNLNYADGAYGSEERIFNMALEDNYAISDVATVKVPTTIMAIFGNDHVPITVACEAMLNFSDTDVMFVLDTTGSMSQSNPDDPSSRIVTLRQVVIDFHAELEASKSPQSRVRYGFVPYSTNVNVGHLLADNWVVSDWTYQSREKMVDLVTPKYSTYTTNWITISGTFADNIINTYAATYKPPVVTPGVGEAGSDTTGSGTWSCTGTQPKNTVQRKDTLLSQVDVAVAGPPPGTKTTKRFRRVTTRTEFWTTRTGETCTVYQRDYTDYTQEFDEIREPGPNETWNYAPIARNVSNWRKDATGCMEERDSYEILTAGETVDFSRALDLDIDTVPSAGNAATQWRPMYPNIIYERKLTNATSGAFQVAPALHTGNYFRPTSYGALVACPAKAQKLQEMNASQVNKYVNTLTPNGQTYHDIGMIWGGRLLSPTGLFASENADQPNRKVSRHLIYLTDGQTEPLDIAYGAYGVEPLDRRRWRSTAESGVTLDRIVEIRFGIACNEVKKRNITVWVIGFGTTMSDAMKLCAGEGRWFQADNAEQLSQTFSKIAKSMAELRVSK